MSCRHMREIDCGCDFHDGIEMDPDWKPSDRHALAIAEVERLIEKWRPRMPWLAGWTVRVRPIPEGHGEWSMRIDTALYVKIATIEVRESVLDEDDILEDEHSVELMVLHELSHVLFETGRYVFMNWLVQDEEVPQPALLAMQDSEESAVWSLSRAMLAMERELQDAMRDAIAYKSTTDRLTAHMVRSTRGKKAAKTVQE